MKRIMGIYCKRLAALIISALVIVGTTSCTTPGDKRTLPQMETKKIDEGARREKARHHFRLAQDFLKDGDLLKAEEEITVVLSLDPHQPVPRLLAGDIFYAQGKFEKALAQYKHAVDLDKTRGLPYAKLGRVYNQLGRQAEAIEAFQNAIQLDPSVPVLHRDLGHVYQQMGLTDQAEEEFEKAERLQSAGQGPAAAETSGFSTRSSKKKDQDLDSAIEKMVKLGDEFLKEGLVSLAIEEYLLALKQRPRHLIANMRLGDAYTRKGMLPEAADRYEKVLALKPDFPFAYAGLGKVYAKMFEIDKSIAVLQKGIALAPDIAPLHFELAMTYYMADQLDAAVVELQKTVALESTNPKPAGILEKVEKEKNAEAGFATLRTEYFVFKYAPAQDKDFIDYTLTSLQSAYRNLVADMSYQPQGRIVVKLYPDLKAFHQAASTPEWFSRGVASAKEDKLLLATPKREINIEKFPQVVTHELTHVFTNLMTYGNHPAWLHEGLAQYQAGQWDVHQEKMLRRAVSDNRLFSLDELEKPFTGFKHPAQIQLAYAQSYAAVQFILDRYGRPKLLEMLHAFSRGQDFSEAVGAVFGLSPQEFEAHWHDFVKTTYA